MSAPTAPTLPSTTIRAVTPQTRAISSTTRSTSRTEPPDPPYSRGMASPMKPAATRSFTLSQGYASSASQRAARSRNTPSASVRARTWSACCAAPSWKSIKNPSDVDGLAEGGQGGLEGGLGERRVRVDGVDDLLERRLERAPYRKLVDHLRRLRAQDVDTENLAGGLVGDHLEEALGLPQRHGLAIGREGKAAARHLASTGTRGRLAGSD